MDWTTAPVDTNPEGALFMSQGDDDLFGGRIPSRYLGLTCTSRPKDPLLLDIKYGMVHWQACPSEILASASQGPSFGDDDEEVGGEAEGGGGHASDAESNADSNADSDAASDDELDWGPCWSVRYFFEILKNQLRDLNFVPKNSHQVIDVWTTTHEDGHMIPPGIPALLQPIYRKHGWPDLQAYNKEECLKEVKSTVEKTFPYHHQYHL